MRGRTYSRNSQSSTATTGVRPEVTRDNMGHTTIDVTQNVYSKSWWEERPCRRQLGRSERLEEVPADRQSERSLRTRRCKPWRVNPSAFGLLFDSVKD